MLLFIVVLNLIFSLFRFPFINVSPFEAIPNHSPIIIDQASFDKASFQDFNIDNYTGFSYINQLTKDRESLVQIFGDTIFNQDIRSLIIPQKVGAKKIDYLYVFDLRNNQLDFKKLESEFEFSTKSTINFLGNRYHKFQTKNDQTFSIYKFRNLLVVSKYTILIEDAIRQLENFQQNVFIEKEFRTVYHKKLDKQRRKVYLNFKNCPKFFSSFFKEDSRKFLDAFSNFTTWVSFDFNNFSNLQISGDFVSSQPQKIKRKITDLRELSMLNVIPENAGLLYAQQGVSLVGMQDSLVQQFLDPWLSDEWAFSIINSRSSADRLLFLRAKDAEYAAHYLDKYGMLSGELLSTSYQTFPLKQLLGTEIIKPFLDHLQLKFKNPYYTIIDKTVVFAENRQAIELLIDKHIVGQTILKNTAFQNFLNNASDQSNAMLYIDRTAISFVLMKMLEDKKLAFFEQTDNLKSDHLTGGIHFYNGKKKTPFQLDFTTNLKKEESTEILWRVALPANVSTPPIPLWNTMRQEYEIVVQDESHRLYLLNNTGEIIWKRALKEPLLSEIYQVDYYGEENQMLFFNTANNIYLLDRDGKDIGNYPLHLQSPATNGMSLIDFKKNKHYKIFLACENGYAYGFTKDGNPVYGWNPKRNVGKVIQPFEHFQYKGKDYIVILNEAGKLASFNSEGKSAFPKLAVGESFRSKPEILNMGARKVIALSNNEGQIKIINSRGDAYKISLNDEKEANVKIAFANIVGDPRKDFVALDKKKVRCFYPDQKKMKQYFEIDFQYDQDEVFKVESGSQPYSFFGTLCKAKKQIHLFSSENKLHEDFPLAGTTSFCLVDLFKNDNNVLLVGLDNSVYAYKIKPQIAIN